MLAKRIIAGLLGIGALAFAVFAAGWMSELGVFRRVMATLAGLAIGWKFLHYAFVRRLPFYSPD